MLKTTGQVTMVPEVYMRCVTWTRDSNGLFDYESKNIAKRNIKSVTGGKLVRMGEEVQLVAKDNTNEDFTRMLTVLKGDGINFKVCNDSDGSNSMFVVVRNTNSSSSNADYQLEAGDVMKLGRCKFRVKQVNGKCFHEDEDEQIKTIRHNDQEPCRFCWSNE